MSSDLENLEMSGNFDAERKVREFMKKTKKVRDFCCKKFIFSQSEHPNFESFLVEHGIPFHLETGHTGSGSLKAL